MSALETPQTPVLDAIASRLRRYVFALPAMLVFARGALSHIGVPGMYFDAINPDYLALRLFAMGKGVPAFVIPGQMMFDKLPVLIQIYHGALPFYFGLPALFLFGTDVVGVRIANFSYGLLVLAGLAMALGAFRVRPIVAGTVLAALALDPGLVLDFRTQYHITTLPISLFFASIAITERGAGAPSRGQMFLAGVLAGLTVYGYFLYAFLLPAAAIHALARRPAGAGARAMGPWIAGVALGLAPYPLGVFLIFLATGPSGFARFFFDYFQDLAVVKANWPFWKRWQLAVDMLRLTAMSVGPWGQITKDALPYAFWIKGPILFGALPAAFALGFVRPRRLAGPAVVAGALAGLVALFLVFAKRAGLHHAAPALPLLYFGLALAADRVLALANRPWLGYVAPALAFVPIVAVGFCDGVDLQHAMTGIERTGGVGMYSEAFLRFADDVARDPAPKQRVFLPDWGMMIPFEMQTGGLIANSGDANSTYAHQMLCEGRDTVLAIHDEPTAKRIDDWSAALGAPPTEVKAYNQLDGAPVMTSARWRAASYPRSGCGA